MKRLPALFFLLIFSLMLSACGAAPADDNQSPAPGTNESPAPTESPGQEQKTMNISP